MSKEEKELKAQPEANNESLADSKKIDLYINNQEDQEQGISIMNVFSTLGKRFHLYVFVMIATFLLGLLVPTLMYTFKDKKESAVAVLGFDYAGAEEGKAPDGSPFDITLIKSSYIVQNALDNVTLTKKVTTAQVQSNITITRPLTDDTKRMQEVIQELKEAKHNDYAELVKNFQLQYRNQYFIFLQNGFKDGNNKIKLDSNDLNHLLSAITNAYNDYYVDTYLVKNLPDNLLDAINEETLDYLEILDQVSASLNYLANYCNDRAASLPGYRTKDGVSFSDLANIISTLQSVDIQYIYSYIDLNNIYKDKLVLKTYYEMQLKQVDLDLTEVENQIDTLKSAISSFPDGSISVQSPDGTPVNVPYTDPEKNRLELELTTANENKSALEERKAVLFDRITKLDGPEATAEQKAKADEYVTNALADARNVYTMVSENADELFNSNAYQSRYMHKITTSDSEKFSDNLKLFLIGAAAGLAIGLVAWVADAFIIEFKAVKKANENKEAK